MALTKKQQMFVKEYLIDLNSTQAAIRAGYSEKTSSEMGYENLNKPHVAAAIQIEMDKRAERVESEADWVLRTIKETTEALLPDQEKNAANIFKGCELIGKHHKLFTDKVIQETTGANGGPIENHHVWEINVKRAEPPKKATKGKK